MKTVFERITEPPEEYVLYADYTPAQLITHLMKNYAGDPVGVLYELRNRGDIGEVLFTQTNIILEAYGYVKK